MSYFNVDQLSERRPLDINNSLSTYHNNHENNGISQLNNSCREGESKRRHLFEINAMDDINHRQPEEYEYSDLMMSKSLNTFVNNTQPITIQQNNNLISITNQNQTRLDTNFKESLTPQQIISPSPDFLSYSFHQNNNNINNSFNNNINGKSVINSNNNLNNNSMINSNNKKNDDGQLQQTQQQQFGITLRSGELIPSMNHNQLKSLDTFLPHSRSDAVEQENINNKNNNNNKMTSNNKINNNNNNRMVKSNINLEQYQASNVDLQGDDGKITTNRMLVSKPVLSSTGGLNEQQQQQHKKRKSKKFNYFFLFQRTNLVKKFVNNLKNKASKYIFRRFQQKQFDILEDLSADFSYYERNGLIIQRESMISIFWEILSIITYLLLIIILPIDNNFELAGLRQYNYIHSIPLLMIPIEIFLKLNTAVYKRGMMMQNRREIFKQFIKSDAKIDLLTLLIYSVSQLKDHFNILEYVITVKIIQVISQLKNLINRLDSQMKYTTAIKIVILILIILTFSHTQATIFVRIGLHEMNSGQESWIGLLKYDNPSYTQIYISSLYWSLITMATIGYGDIHPQTEIEMIYVSIISLISCGIYGYSLNQIGQIVDQFEKQTELFNIEMKVLNRQMNQRGLNSKLQHKVRKYFEYLHKEDQVDDDKANQMIANLPSSMKQGILFDINHKVLYQQKAFALNFSKPFLDLLALEMKTVKLGPEIDLFPNNESDNNRIYFILKGQVEIYINLSSKQKTCYFLKKGDMFGDIEFLCQQNRIKAAKTLNVVTLLYIEFKDFLTCIKNFDEDFQKYSMIKDRARLYNNLEGLDRRCLSCNKFNHQFVSCPQLQYWPNMDKLIFESNKTSQQERQESYERKDREKQKTLRELTHIQQMCRQFNYSNQIDDENNEGGEDNNDEDDDEDDEEQYNNNEQDQDNNQTYLFQSQNFVNQQVNDNNNNNPVVTTASAGGGNVGVGGGGGGGACIGAAAGGGPMKVFKLGTVQNFSSSIQLEELNVELPSYSYTNLPNPSSYTPVVGGQRNKAVNSILEQENNNLRRGNSRKVSKKLSIKKELKRGNSQINNGLQSLYDDEQVSPNKRNKISFDFSSADVIGGISFNSNSNINNINTNINNNLNMNNLNNIINNNANNNQQNAMILQQNTIGSINNNQFVYQSQKQQQQQQQQQQQMNMQIQPIQGTSLQFIPHPQQYNGQSPKETNNNNQIQQQGQMPQIELDVFKTFSKVDFNHTNSKNTKSNNEVNLMTGNGTGTGGQNQLQQQFFGSDRYLFLSIIEPFDKIKHFKIYFPQNNAQNVLKSYIRYAKQTSSLMQNNKVKQKRKLTRH